MVKVIGPLGGLDASGTIGDMLVFSKWKGRNYVRKHAIPSNPRSGLQVGIRSTFKFISQDFKNLSAGDLADWAALAAADNITNLNAQIRDAVDRVRRNLAPRENTTDADPGSLEAPINGAAAAQPKTLVLTWDDPAANPPDHAWMIFRSTTTGFTPDVSNLVAVTKHPDETLTDKGLTSGTEYFYRIRGISTSGFLGVLCAQFAGTPT